MAHDIAFLLFLCFIFHFFWVGSCVQCIIFCITGLRSRLVHTKLLCCRLFMMHLFGLCFLVYRAMRSYREPSFRLHAATVVCVPIYDLV